MSNFLVIILVSFITFMANAEHTKTAYKTFKNKKCGYQFDYPGDWYPHNEQEEDDITGIEPAVDESVAIVMYLIEQKRQHCKYKSDCNLAVGCSGDGSEATYLKSLKLDNDYIKHEKRMNPPRTVIKEMIINGEKAELVVREGGDFGGIIFIYCEKVYRSVVFSAGRSYNSEYKNFDDLTKKPLVLEKLFTSDQLVIINSIQCPAPDFIYKPEKKAIKSKK